MKRWLIMAFLVAACATEEHPPKELLDRDTFKHLLKEAQLIEARTSQEVMTAENTATTAGAQYEELFATAKVPSSLFRATFDWYSRHPEQLKPIYEEILVELQHAADSTAHAPAK